MTTYESLLWLHVSFAVLWAGGSIFLTVMGAKIAATGPEERAYFMSLVEWFGLRYFAPVSLLTLIFGVLLAVEGDWDFSELWITGGFVVFLVSFLIGAAYFGPTSARISQRVEEHGAEDPQAQAMIDRVLWVARADSFLLLTVIYLMTAKPTI